MRWREHPGRRTGASVSSAQGLRPQGGQGKGELLWVLWPRGGRGEEGCWAKRPRFGGQPGRALSGPAWNPREAGADEDQVSQGRRGPGATVPSRAPFTITCLNQRRGASPPQGRVQVSAHRCAEVIGDTCRGAARPKAACQGGCLSAGQVGLRMRHPDQPLQATSGTPALLWAADRKLPRPLQLVLLPVFVWRQCASRLPIFIVAKNKWHTSWRGPMCQALE